MRRLAEGFANERSGLIKQWDRGDNVSTQDRRVALQRYRSFLDRLLKLLRTSTPDTAREPRHCVEGLNVIS
jgi:hypothetical protein